MHKAKKVLNCSHKMHKLKVMRTCKLWRFTCHFFPIFSNGMEVDGLHIRVDLTGQNNKVINIIRNISLFSLAFHFHFSDNIFVLVCCEE